MKNLRAYLVIILAICMLALGFNISGAPELAALFIAGGLIGIGIGGSMRR